MLTSNWRRISPYSTYFFKLLRISLGYSYLLVCISLPMLLKSPTKHPSSVYLHGSLQWILSIQNSRRPKLRSHPIKLVVVVPAVLQISLKSLSLSLHTNRWVIPLTTDQDDLISSTHSQILLLLLRDTPFDFPFRWRISLRVCASLFIQLTCWIYNKNIIAARRLLIVQSRILYHLRVVFSCECAGCFYGHGHSCIAAIDVVVCVVLLFYIQLLARHTIHEPSPSCVDWLWR